MPEMKGRPPGGAPLPTAVLKVRGSRMPYRRELAMCGGEEPEPLPGKGDTRSLLDDESRKEFNHLRKILEEMRVFSVTDAIALARYCVLLVEFRDAIKDLQEKGQTQPVYDKEGNEVGNEPRGSMAIMLKLAPILNRMESEFGLTPSARTRIRVPKKEPDENKDKARFFKPKAG